MSDTVIKEKVLIPMHALTIFLVVINTTMFNVALPSVQHEFGLAASTASWIVTGYSIIFAIASITYSRLSDFIPIKRLMTIGLSIYAVASLIGFFADHFVILLIARLMQAAGAAAGPGVGSVLVARYVPLSRRGKSMSLVSTASSFAFGLGPVIGGWVTQFLGWNYLFVVTGFVLMLLPFLRRQLPQENVHRVKFDFVGAVLVFVGVAGVLLFLTTFNYIILVVALVALFLCWRHIHRVEIPFVQPKLLRNRGYLLILAMAFSTFAIHFGALFLMPLMLTKVFAKSAGEVGMIIFPGAMMSAIVARYVGRTLDRLGTTIVIRIGHILLLIAPLVFAIFGHLSPYSILFGYMFMSVGYSSLNSSINNEISRVIPKEGLGTAMGMMQLTQFFGGAFGVSMSGVMMVWQHALVPTDAFRNIFLVMAALVVVSFVCFMSYLKLKRKMPLQCS